MVSQEMAGLIEGIMVYQSLLDFPEPDDSKLTLFRFPKVTNKQPLSSGHGFFTIPKRVTNSQTCQVFGVIFGFEKCEFSVGQMA